MILGQESWSHFGSAESRGLRGLLLFGVSTWTSNEVPQIMAAILKVYLNAIYVWDLGAPNPSRGQVQAIRATDKSRKESAAHAPS